MRKSVLLMVAVVLAAAVLFAGCTGSQEQSAPAGTPAATAEQTSVPAAPTEAPAASADLTVGETEQPKDMYVVAVDIAKDDVYGTIEAIFRGGAGQNFVNDITVDVYRPDGSHDTQHFAAGVGVNDILTFDGTKLEQDRVKVTVQYMGNIGTYVTQDVLVPAKISQRARD